MYETEPPSRPRDGRAEPRSNMYIAAILSSQGAASAAKIRNMSSSGALVEVPTLPAVGSVVHLSRGALSLEGVIAWALGGRCGIRFQSLVSVKEWMAPTKNVEQRRVDETVSLLRAGAVPLAEVRRTHSSAVRMPESDELAADLSEVALLLGRLGAELAQDGELVARHSRSLQCLDLAQQTLDVIVEGLANVREGQAERGPRLQNLRVSRAQALRTA